MIMILKLISTKLQISENQIHNVIKLLDEGATIPFISRYRKEATGALDEVQIAAIADENSKLVELVKRKETVLSTIDEQGKLTDELKKQIENCWNATELEDIYLPYKPKRRTRAQIAIERGLEPLAKIIMTQREGEDIEYRAEKFLNENVENVADAISGAKDIIAEWVNESSSARNAIRQIFRREAVISSKVVKGKEQDGDKYLDYFEMNEPLRRIASHRLLAMRRGEQEGFLKIDISADEDVCLERLDRIFVRNNSEAANYVAQAAKDSFKRLLKPSIETEFASESKEKADKEAIRIFAENLRQLLLASPLGQKRVLAIDPGFRTGCKVVTLDAQGNLLHNDTIYPHPPVNKSLDAMKKISTLTEQYKIEAIAIGNGTAGRETEDFIKKIHFNTDIQVFVVSENGASIYSASKIAREEFPEYDVTVRGAVSLGRRLIDPLAELVKIDPKSIGVGQYQHDVEQKELKNSLDFVVMSCVNSVGVNLNTASKYLLTYISGIGTQLAQNIVDFRAENGAFSSRKELLKVSKMGAKSFEQCAGFIRVENSANPLDNSAVHPESYAIVEKMAKDLDVEIADLLAKKELRDKIVLQKYVTEKVGLPTLNDILKELEKPTRDPRTEISVFEFDQSVKTIGDLRVGMKLPGIITNITKFGAFVDIGLHENGLIHISQLAKRFISDPLEVVSLHQQVIATVIDIDLQRKRIQLSLVV
ncbi:MAG: RNA-binding transcriptional accessory protein [Prevotellaceae bacterium]|nr:RNA-binding transcriptional accessory protein [Prevotellaceae bacterium]